MSNFCVENVLVNPKCYSLEVVDFLSEESIFDIVLDLLKSELPPRMARLKDCQDKPMYIAEDDIDLTPSENNAKFSVILNPTDSTPVYSENRIYRQVSYNFELFLTVRNTQLRCLTWELIRFKNAIEGLIIATEFAIDGYETVEVEPKGFNYFVPDQDGTGYVREGAYKFTVSVSQYKI